MVVGSVSSELRARFGEDVVLADVPALYLSDATESRGLEGHAEAVALPRTPDEVAGVLAWCYGRCIAVTPRGGGTGFAGGAVPFGGVVVSLERLRAVRSFDPLLWRMEVEAGLTTAEVRRLARENGLLFPPDPGAAEQSQIGGNVATNAGGPHAFKYGVTGAWVTGIEAVVPPGDLVRVDGALRKDVAGYDLVSLLVGCEGTLGIVTSVWLRLLPAPEAAAPVVAFYPGTESGCEAVTRVLGSGIGVAALEYLDAATVELAAGSFPGPAARGFIVIAEVDGATEEVASLREELLEALAEEALGVWAPTSPTDVAALWRWRDGVSIAVQVPLGGKVSEDIAVPLDRLAEAVAGTIEIGERAGLRACSWGHAGDGNLHSTFLVRPGDEDDLRRAERASEQLFELAVSLGGTASGEHGLGVVKQGALARQWSPRAHALHTAVKNAFDPHGLLNPGKKL